MSKRHDAITAGLKRLESQSNGCLKVMRCQKLMGVRVWRVWLSDPVPSKCETLRLTTPAAELLIRVWDLSRFAMAGGMTGLVMSVCEKAGRLMHNANRCLPDDKLPAGCPKRSEMTACVTTVMPEREKRKVWRDANGEYWDYNDSLE